MISANNWSKEIELIECVMPHRVQHILLIASLYDTFVFEVDGFLAEQVAADFYLLNLTTQPTIYHASSRESALNQLQYEQIDVVIIHLASMRGLALELIANIKEIYYSKPIVLLLSTPMDLMFIENHVDQLRVVDDFFYWNGDSKLFLAIVKQLEEKLNIEHDTKIYDIPIIIVIETFIPYYSQFLPLLYEQILLLNQDVIRREHQDFNKTLYMNARPRILLLHDFSSAVEFFSAHSDCIIGIISNVNYNYRGEFDRDAGLKLLQYVRKRKPTLPFLLQSFNPMYRDIVTSNEGEFLYKDLPGLKIQIRRWLENEIGFGKFIFRKPDQSYVCEAQTLIGFLHCLSQIPNESLIYHFKYKHIHNWLNTHAEVALSIYLKHMVKWEEPEELRKELCDSFQSLIEYRRREKIQDWNEESTFDINLIYKIGEDSIGGKGRGLAFLNVVINRFSNVCEKYTNATISVPVAAVLATGEFDKFLANNPHLKDIEDLSDSEIDLAFVKSSFTDSTIMVLQSIVSQTNFPLAIRSSSVLEDSITNPFAGIFRTFLIPNSHPNQDIRLEHLIIAIKLVYASMFLKNARVYRESLRIPSREEKMAIIIQRVAGSRHEEYFYPLVSGVAQSYNYYPGSNMKHEDGIVTLSTGLGKTAVERERTFAFCPAHQNKDMFTAVNIVSYAPRHLYAIAPNKNDFNLLEGEDVSLERLRISQKLCETELVDITSVWDHDNKEFISGKYAQGPRVVTYRSLLHYNLYPLAPIIKDFLQLGREVMGCEVEMEFAFDIDAEKKRCSFFLLQIRPIAVNCMLYSEPLESYLDKRHELLLFSSYALGSEIKEELNTVIYINPEKFSIVKTEEMVIELEEMNQEMRNSNTKYVLIGPGRWGSSDRFLGIPVVWSQISNAQVIVEVVLPYMSIEASHGSHFFHNLFSMNVAYLTVCDKAQNDYLDWEWLDNQESLLTGQFFIVKRLPQECKILFDGKNAVIKK